MVGRTCISIRDTNWAVRLFLIPLGMRLLSSVSPTCGELGGLSWSGLHGLSDRPSRGPLAPLCFQCTGRLARGCCLPRFLFHFLSTYTYDFYLPAFKKRVEGMECEDYKTILIFFFIFTYSKPSFPKAQIRQRKKSHIIRH